jgi:hypothetical protein
MGSALTIGLEGLEGPAMVLGSRAAIMAALLLSAGVCSTFGFTLYISSIHLQKIMMCLGGRGEKEIEAGTDGSGLEDQGIFPEAEEDGSSSSHVRWKEFTFDSILPVPCPLAVELLEAAVNIEGILTVQRKGNEFRDER